MKQSAANDRVAGLRRHVIGRSPPGGQFDGDSIFRGLQRGDVVKVQPEARQTA